MESDRCYHTLHTHTQSLSKDTHTSAVVLTHTGDYYCAGVDLSGSFELGTPQNTYNKIVESNRNVFDTFLDFEKPLIAACNGHAIGASVTSATLCDAIVAASPEVTFTTPFGRLGISPEGCSSVRLHHLCLPHPPTHTHSSPQIHFEKCFGKDFANEMLKENRVLRADEALSIGFVDEVVEKEDMLLSRARKIASERIGKPRKIHGEELTRYKDVNLEESHDLAKAFMSEKFLQAQIDFASSKGKNVACFVLPMLRLFGVEW